MKYRLKHKSRYDYETPVFHARHMVKKRPRSLPHQTVSQSSVRCTPNPIWSVQEAEYFGNLVDVIEILDSHEQFEVIATSDLVLDAPLFDPSVPALLKPWETVRERIQSDLGCFEVWEMTMESPLVPSLRELQRYAQVSFGPGRPLLEAATELNHRIFTEYAYDPTFSDVATPLLQVTRERRGVCQDFAHVFVGALRTLGLGARYVSGYLETFPPPGKPRLIGADASHAWASVYFPDYGWLDFDPTNDLLPHNRHITIGWGRDYSDVSPLKGVVHGGGRHTVSVSVDVAPLDESGRRMTDSVPPSVTRG